MYVYMCAYTFVCVYVCVMYMHVRIIAHRANFAPKDLGTYVERVGKGGRGA